MRFMGNCYQAALEDLWKCKDDVAILKADSQRIRDEANENDEDVSGEDPDEDDGVEF